MVADLLENFAAGDESLLGLGILAQLGMQPAHGHRVVIWVGRQPYVSHATAVDDFLQIVFPKVPGLPGLRVFTTKNIEQTHQKEKAATRSVRFLTGEMNNDRQPGEDPHSKHSPQSSLGPDRITSTDGCRDQGDPHGDVEADAFVALRKRGAHQALVIDHHEKDEIGDREQHHAKHTGRLRA